MASRLPLFLVLLALACSRTTLKSSVVDTNSETDEFGEMDFWDALAEVGAVSNNDALHALLINFDGPKTDDFKARLSAARQRGWLQNEAQVAPNETASVGWIAKAVCIEAGIKGGMTMRLLGPSRRYATNELNYMGWLPGMSSNQSLSGAQLIALLSSAEDHLADTPDTPREDF